MTPQEQTLEDIDSILDEMGAEIRELRQEIMAQNVLTDAYKEHSKMLKRENNALKYQLERAA